MADKLDEAIDRRGVLKCMVWAGTGVLWTVAAACPKARRSWAKRPPRRRPGRLQLRADSDSHIGFDKPANPDRARQRFSEAIAKVKPAAQAGLHDPHRRYQPSVAAEEFDDADQIIGAAGSIPIRARRARHARRGQGKAYLDRYGKGARHGLVQLRSSGRAFRRPGQRRRPQGRRHGQSRRRAARLAGRRSQGERPATPIVVFAHIPLWTVYQEWGWGTDDGVQALGAAEAVRLGDGAERPHPPDHAEGRGQHRVPHRALDGVPAAGARHGARRRADEGCPPAGCARCSASPVSA